MADMELSDVLALMLAAGGPEHQPARVRWPLHLALREMHDACGRRGSRHLLALDLELRPSADVGQEVIGADKALGLLVQRGVLRPDGEHRTARLALDPQAAVVLRRRLMMLPPAQVALLQRAGARWAALTSTAAKNRSTASRSSASTVASGTPNLANFAAGEGA
jgi:hypothetical protein